VHTEKRPTNDLLEEIRDSVKKEYLESNKQKRTLLFLDDVAADSCTNQGRKGAFGQLILESNHIGLTIIGIFQQVTSCSAVFRDNAEDIIVFPPAREDDFNRIKKEFIPSQFNVVDRDQFERAMVGVWQDGNFVFIHRPARQAPQVFEDFNRPLELSFYAS